MNKVSTPAHRPRSHCVTDVRIPKCLVARPESFGGTDDGPYLRGDLVVADGIAQRLEPAQKTALPRLILPRFTEAHVHLDKCHCVDRLPSVGGDLRAAIDAQFQDKANWTEDDLRTRATRGLQELIASGCQKARSHVDWTHGDDARKAPLAWHVLSELAEEYSDQIDLQLAPLVSLYDLHDPATARLLGQELARNGGALGSFVLDQPERMAGIQAAFDIAAHYGCGLDFHVDEGLAPGLDGLSLIAQTALDRGFAGPVLCGHACSLMNCSGDRLAPTLDLIARADISVASLPTTNLYLQGRADGTPDRRGVTRIRELRAAGVNVVVGTDNVRDAFCPVGRHDPRNSLSVAILSAHLDPPLADLWPMITTNAARALGRDPGFVDGAGVEDLLLSDAPSSSEALTADAPMQPLQNLQHESIT